MEKPLAVNVVVFLDPVTEFNGPLILVPGSHKEGVLHRTKGGETSTDDWKENVSADLRYTVSAEMLDRIVSERKMVAPKGDVGTVLLFHPNVVHGSVSNLSPNHRRLLIVTYNRTDNAPDPSNIHRPEFLVSRNSRPIVPKDRDRLPT